MSSCLLFIYCCFRLKPWLPPISTATAATTTPVNVTGTLRPVGSDTLPAIDIVVVIVTISHTNTKRRKSANGLVMMKVRKTTLTVTLILWHDVPVLSSPVHTSLPMAAAHLTRTLRWLTSPSIKGPGAYFNINMLSSQYRNFHYKNEKVVRLCYRYNGWSYSGKTTSLYGDSPQIQW